jgi:hypothetical protein
MNAAGTGPASHTHDWSGPAAAIAMAVVGACIVAAGLLAIGMRDGTGIEHWMPPSLSEPALKS